MHLIEHALPSHLHTHPPCLSGPLYPCLQGNIALEPGPTHRSTDSSRPHSVGRIIVVPWTFLSGSNAAFQACARDKRAGFTLMRPWPAVPATSFLSRQVVGTYL